MAKLPELNNGIKVGLSVLGGINLGLPVAFGLANAAFESGLNRTTAQDIFQAGIDGAFTTAKFVLAADFGAAAVAAGAYGAIKGYEAIANRVNNYSAPQKTSEPLQAPK